MKRFFMLLIAAFILFTGQAHAQRYLPKMKGIELRGGLVDGVRQPMNYYTGIGLSTYTQSGNRWVFGGEFLSKQYAYQNMSIPKHQFTAEGGYYYKFLSDYSKTFFLSIGGSALAGYEHTDYKNKVLIDDNPIRNREAFIYGGAITLELEAYLSDRVVLLLNARERILGGSSSGHFHTQFGLGIKFILN